MGYTTDFVGQFKLNKALNAAQILYLQAFSGSRRVHRNSELAALVSDPLREAVGLPVGKQGGYCVFSASDGNFGQSVTPDVVNDNEPPKDQPGLWCQWVPTADGTAIVWDGGEKFYENEEWLRYITDHFLTPWGISFLDSEVRWQGEDTQDGGIIFARGHQIEAVPFVPMSQIAPSWRKGSPNANERL